MPKKTILAALFITQILFFASVGKVFADSTPPITTYIQTPAAPDGDNGWYVSPVRFELNSTDLESGVKEINYRIDGGTWQKVEFTDSLNLAPNPSFELAGPAPSNLEDWEATVVDGSGVYARDTGEYYPGFDTSSARIIVTDGTWHGINNQSQFSAAVPFGNMAASVWVKTENVTGTAFFKMYAVSQDGTAAPTYVELGQSNTLAGTNDWTLLNLNFIASNPNTIGVYMDLGLDSAGTVWADAVIISDSLTNATTEVTIGSDSESHTFEYYAVDVATNAEAYGCPATNCVTFKLDQTPPGGWYDSGAFRGFFGPSYMLWTYTNVKDETSGLSVFTDKFQIKTELNPEFGIYSFILSCSSTWLPDSWFLLISPPFIPGVKEAFLLAPKTSFCNDNWNICKLVKFYSEDMAGNVATKDFCVNGPWIRLSGEGMVRANSHIDMLAEADGDNTDGLIEVGGNTIDFFSSSTDWEVRDSPPPIDYNYQRSWDDMSSVKEEITDGNLRSETNIYFVDSDFTVNSGNTPGDYDDATFDQIVFINGNLRIENDLEVHDNSTALFIVKGDVEISKTVELVDVGIFADGDFFTSYDIAEGDSTEILVLRGVFSANKFVFQRTLVGTSNSDLPSEDFIFEAKYLVQQRDFYKNRVIDWSSVE